MNKIVDGEEVPMTSEEIAEWQAGANSDQGVLASSALTVGAFIARFRYPEEADAFTDLDDLMLAEHRLIVRQWRNDVAEIVEGAGFYDVIAGHLDGLVSAERKAELLA